MKSKYYQRAYDLCNKIGEPGWGNNLHNAIAEEIEQAVAEKEDEMLQIIHQMKMEVIRDRIDDLENDKKSIVKIMDRLETLTKGQRQ